MPSSKFSSAPPARKRPAICKLGPPESVPPLPPTPPLQLNAYVHAMDADPLAAGDQVDSFNVLWNPVKKLYFGRSSPHFERLDLTFAVAVQPNRWNALLLVWDVFRRPDSFLFPNIYVNPNVPFATEKFGGVNISGKDFRVIQLLE